MTAAFEPNQVVWVKIGDKNEEPGTIVAINCDHQDEQGNWRTDGVFVRLNVSNYRIMYAPHQLRPMEEDGDERPSRRCKDVAPSSAVTKPRAVRRFVTPSPQPKAAEQQETPDDVASPEEAKKPAAKRKERPAAASKTETEDDSSTERAPKQAKKTQNSSESPYFDKKKPARSNAPIDSLDPKPAAAKKAKKPKVQLIQIENDSEASDNSGDDIADSDGDDDDRQFKVDYAPTARATCRRCDERISKGSVRVSHVPLFRGQAGYTVYRHLQCALFSDDIETAQDVGGWRKLSKEDFMALALRVEESKLEIEKENEELQPDELVQTAFQGETRLPPPGLTANMLPFQQEGLSWMYHQEVKVHDIRGGILADEMGMGKTLQTIAVILDNRPILQHSKPGAKHPPSSPDIEFRKREEGLWKTSLDEWKHEMEMNNVPKKLISKKGAARAGTLVVCPLIALSQWKAEIEKFTEPDIISVGIYHGPNRASEMPEKMLQKYDVVLTTYQVLEADFRKMVSPNKVTCPNCGGKFKIDKLHVHLKYFCGENAQRTEAQARQRRTADRRRGGQSGGNRTKKKPPMTKTFEEKAPPKKKKEIRLSHTVDYDSDSELSIDEVAMRAARPSRSAAQSASKKLSASVKEWGASNPFSRSSKSDSDEETSYASDPESSEESGAFDDDSSSEEESLVDLGSKKRKAVPVKAASKKAKSYESQALKRAREKQQKALEAAKMSGKGGLGKGKKSGKKAMAKKSGKGKREDKKFDSSSDDDSFDNEDDDPMAGIDLNELMEEAMEGSQRSVLHSFTWWRIVLDEAHFIKSRSSQTAAAASALAGIHRWCLSGTPLQNRVGELYSLIRFLRIDPMAFYFCRQKDCGCRSIHYRFKDGKCMECGHRKFSHFAHFNKHVLNPIQRDGYTGDGRRAMFKLKTEVLDKCLIRRTKESRAEDMNLPPRIVSIRSIRLHPIEEDFYEALYTQTKNSFDDYVAEGTLLNNYAHIFDLLTKMRQAVDHPYLIVHSKKASVAAAGRSATPVANGSVDCDMCHEPPTDRVVSSCCGAGFCRSCVLEYLTVGVGGDDNNNNNGTPCPSCQAPFTIDLNQAASEEKVDDGTLSVPSRSSSGDIPSLKELSHVSTGSILRRINLAEFATSTKIEVLIQELVEMRQKRPGSKALCFSQFVNMLDLVRWRLHSDPCLADLGLGVRILHGGMDAKSRDAALKDFREDPKCRVLLMSLKAAGVALNLTVASECFLLDLWWNPAAELQAIDRTHRLGQYRPIRAVRFVAEGTVEERVLQLQEKKRLVFDGTVGRDAGSLKMLTVDDMKALFT